MRIRAYLDRYAAQNEDFVRVVSRIAVLGAPEARQANTVNQPRGSAGISRSGAPWVVAVMLTLSTFGLLAQNGASRANGAPRRTATIAGRIIHPEGAAAENARIAVYAVREGAAAGIVGTATSSYDGRYEVTGLPAGTFMVGVTPRRMSGFGGDLKRAPALPAETFYPGVTERERAHPITVFEGVPAEGIDVWLAPAAQRFSIQGRIFWPDGVSDVEDLRIEYGGPEGVRRGVWYVDDPGGLFTIEGASQGTYVLFARAETAAGPLIGIASTDVSLGTVEDVRVMLRQPGSIEGRLVIDSAGNHPLPAFRVAPVQTLLTLSPLYPAEDAAVAEDGRFELPQLAGEYTIDVRGLPGGWRVKRISRNGTTLSTNRVVVGPGERVTGIEVVIGAGST